jgi:hypothetical protein
MTLTPTPRLAAAAELEHQAAASTGRKVDGLVLDAGVRLGLYPIAIVEKQRLNMIGNLV